MMMMVMIWREWSDLCVVQCVAVASRSVDGEYESRGYCEVDGEREKRPRQRADHRYVEADRSLPCTRHRSSQPCRRRIPQ